MNFTTERGVYHVHTMWGFKEWWAVIPVSIDKRYRPWYWPFSFSYKEVRYEANLPVPASISAKRELFSKLIEEYEKENK